MANLIANVAPKTKIGKALHVSHMMTLDVTLYFVIDD